MTSQYGEYQYYDPFINYPDNDFKYRWFSTSRNSYNYFIKHQCDSAISQHEIKNYLWAKPRPEKFTIFYYSEKDKVYRLNSTLFEKSYVAYDDNNEIDYNDIYIDGDEYKCRSNNCSVYDENIYNIFIHIKILTNMQAIFLTLFITI